MDKIWALFALLFSQRSVALTTQVAGGSNFAWYGAGCGSRVFPGTHICTKGTCDWRQKGIVKNYAHAGIRPLVQSQLADMFAAGQRRLRIPVYFYHDAPDDDSTTFYMNSTGGSLSPLYMENLRHVIEDVSVAGFVEAVVGLFPSNHPINDPNQWNATTGFREDGWHENWQLLVAVRHAAREAAGDPLKITIDMLNDGVPRPGFPLVSEYVTRTWKAYGDTFGGHADTYGFAVISDNPQDIVPYFAALNASGYPGPSYFSVHYYNRTQQGGEELITLDRTMEKAGVTFGAARGPAPWAIGETFFNDPGTADMLKKLSLPSKRVLKYVMQWPMSVNRGCAGRAVDVAPPVAYANYRTLLPAAANNLTWMPPLSAGLTPAQRAAKVVAAMTLDEKIRQVHGNGSSIYSYTGLVPANERLGIPQLRLNDGRQGFRNGHDTAITAWPSALTVTSTWDEDLMGQFGAGMGREWYDKGANVALTPMLIIARVPQGGRNFESCGEDPYLASRFGYQEVTGINSQRVLSNADDFVLNNQELGRTTVVAVADERTRFEIYYPSYEGAISAGLATLMCSYNLVNATTTADSATTAFTVAHACENKQTLHEDLKGALGFKGWVLSDWGGTHSAVRATHAGQDMDMPGGPSSFFGAPLKAAVLNGSVPLSRLDDMVTRILTPMFAIGLMDDPNPNNITNNVSSAAHTALARELAAAGTVLLQNNGGALPLSTETIRTIAVIGDDAHKAPICCGTGSGYNNPPYIVTPLQGIRARADDESGVTVTYLPTPTDAASSAATAKLAAAADVAIVCVATISGEGHDRPTLSLGTAQDAMVDLVAAANNRTVVVVHNPGAFLVPWRARVAAIVAAGYPGQEMGHALADVLFGDVNPSGRLPVSFPQNDTDGPLQTPEQYPGINGVVHYTEQLLVGYRWWDAKGVAPAFPFGHGLAFTTYHYSNLIVSDFGPTGGVATIAFDVTNDAGGAAGREVAQLYLAFPTDNNLADGEPPRQLKRFHKTRLLAPGAVETVRFVLHDRDCSVWDVTQRMWEPVTGTFGVHVGTSSRDLRLQGSFDLV